MKEMRRKKRKKRKRKEKEKAKKKRKTKKKREGGIASASGKTVFKVGQSKEK